MYINQLLHILSGFIKIMQSKQFLLEHFSRKFFFLSFHLLTLLYLVDKSSKCVAPAREVGGVMGEVGGVEQIQFLKLNDFLFSSHLDNVNFFKVLRYCERSQISKKVSL